MTLKELFSTMTIKGYVSLILQEKGITYQCYDGYETITVFNCDGKMPSRFEDYANCEVHEVKTSSTFTHDGSRPIQVGCLDISVFAPVADDLCEVTYTGGNIWCGICKLADGWFMGETNSWGCIWKTYSQAFESFPDEEYGYIRDVNDVGELKSIWTHIYSTIISRGGCDADYCKEWLESLDDDLKAEFNLDQ